MLCVLVVICIICFEVLLFIMLVLMHKESDCYYVGVFLIVVHEVIIMVL